MICVCVTNVCLLQLRMSTSLMLLFLGKTSPKARSQPVSSLNTLVDHYFSLPPLFSTCFVKDGSASTEDTVMSAEEAATIEDEFHSFDANKLGQKEIITHVLSTNPDIPEDFIIDRFDTVSAHYFRCRNRQPVRESSFA